MTALYSDLLTNIASGDDADWHTGDPGTNRGPDFLATQLNNLGIALNTLKATLGTTGVVGSYADVEHFLAALNTAAAAATSAATAASSSASATSTALTSTRNKLDASDPTGLSNLLGLAGGGWADLKSLLADMDSRIATQAGPAPVTPGVWLTDAQITAVATLLIAGAAGPANEQSTTYASMSGSSGGMNPGNAGGLSSTITTGTWPTNYVNQSSPNARASQRGTFHTTALTSAEATGVTGFSGGMLDDDAIPKPVAVLHLYTPSDANSAAALINAHGANIAPDGRDIYPAGDFEFQEDARVAYSSAFLAAVLLKVSTLPGGTAFNANAAAWASALATHSAKFVDAWATTLTEVVYDSVRYPGSLGSGAFPLSNSSGTRLYGQAKLAISWASQDWSRAGSLLKTYFGTEWAAVNPNGEIALRNVMTNVLYPHLMGLGGKGDSTTRGWYSAGNWPAVISDAITAIGVFLGDITIRNNGITLFRDYLPASIQSINYNGLQQYGVADSTLTTCPAPFKTQNNNAHGAPVDSASDTRAEILASWNQSSANSGIRSNPSWWDWTLSGPTAELLRDLSHTMLAMGGWAACCETAHHQGVDLYGEWQDWLVPGFELIARALYEYLTGGGQWFNGTTVAGTGQEYNAGSGTPGTNWRPTWWPVIPQNAWTNNTPGTQASNNRNFSFKLGGTGYASGWFPVWNHYVNRVGLNIASDPGGTEPGGSSHDNFYWTNRLLTTNPTGVFVPSAPADSVMGESMSHANVP